MARRSTAALLACALAGSVLLATPAQARWTDVGGSTDFSLCKHTTQNHRAWKFRPRVAKPEGVPDARAGVELWRRGHVRDHWRSGWLGDGEVRRGTVRIRKGRGVRVAVWQEAGDRQAPTGTALEARVLRPRRISHC